MGCGASKGDVIVQPEAPKTSEAAVERAEGIAAAFEKAEDVLNAAQAAATVAARKAAKGDLKGAKEALIDHAVEQRDQALGTFVPTFDEEKKIVKIESVARGQQARSELAAMARLADEEQAKRYDVKKLKREGWAAASPVAIFPGFMSSSLEVKRCDRDKSWVGDRIWCDINKLGAARFIKKDGRLARKQVAEEVADEIEEMLDSPRACVEELLRDGRAVLQQAAGQSTSRLERLERLIASGADISDALQKDEPLRHDVKALLTVQHEQQAAEKHGVETRDIQQVRTRHAIPAQFLRNSLTRHLLDSSSTRRASSGTPLPRAIPARNSAQFSDAPAHRLRRRNGTELPPKAAQNKWLAHMVLNDGWKDTDYCSVRAVQAEFGLDAVRSPDERTRRIAAPRSPHLSPPAHHLPDCRCARSQRTWQPSTARGSSAR